MIARNRSNRVSALALAEFGLPCAPSAFAEPPDCRHGRRHEWSVSLPPTPSPT